MKTKSYYITTMKTKSYYITTMKTKSYYITTMKTKSYYITTMKTKSYYITTMKTKSYYITTMKTKSYYITTMKTKSYYISTMKTKSYYSSTMKSLLLGMVPALKRQTNTHSDICSSSLVSSSFLRLFGVQTHCEGLILSQKTNKIKQIFVAKKLDLEGFRMKIMTLFVVRFPYFEILRKT